MKCEKVSYCPSWRRTFVTREQILELYKLCGLDEINRDTVIYNVRGILHAYLSLKGLYMSDAGTSDQKVLSGTWLQLWFAWVYVEVCQDWQASINALLILVLVCMCSIKCSILGFEFDLRHICGLFWAKTKNGCCLGLERIKKLCRSFMQLQSAVFTLDFGDKSCCHTHLPEDELLL